RAFLRASWLNGNLLRPRERSALYCFTSNYPPCYEDVQLRGVRVTGVKPAGDTGVVPAVGASPVGRVPSPVAPPEEMVALMPALGGGLGSLGGVLPGGVLGGGVGFAPPGLVSAASGIGGGGGGGVPGGGSGGSTGGPGTGTGQQTQSQAPSQPVVNVNVQQTAN